MNLRVATKGLVIKVVDLCLKEIRSSWTFSLHSLDLYAYKHVH
jgi:hypothetical protein